MNWKSLFTKLLVVVLFWSLLFNGILFIYEQNLIRANASLVQYATDNNCGDFGKSTEQVLIDANITDPHKIDFNFLNNNTI